MENHRSLLFQQPRRTRCLQLRGRGHRPDRGARKGWEGTRGAVCAKEPVPAQGADQEAGGKADVTMIQKRQVTGDPLSPPAASTRQNGRNVEGGQSTKT